eukprot:CAMPEP_0180390178 /NCGR_PEP_ID=MMETSP0989-20121125/31836_1 /TAXON_ID=697907 /ORGANISM="non described non described, Strain CCMP2293" /LENGTH=35 /DNA_ID= /DNA_START= /DNA_END= /DNA_ORIENTATION=
MAARAWRSSRSCATCVGESARAVAVACSSTSSSAT